MTKRHASICDSPSIGSPEQIVDCDFAPGKDHEIPFDEAYSKLKSEVAAGRWLRDVYGHD